MSDIIKKDSSFGIGDYLKSIRTTFKLTQDKFSQELGIPRSTYANYENNKSEPTIDFLKRLYTKFNIDIIALITEPNRTTINLDNNTSIDPHQRLTNSYFEFLDAWLHIAALENDKSIILTPLDREVLLDSIISIHYNLIDLITKTATIKQRMLNYYSSEGTDIN